MLAYLILSLCCKRKVKDLAREDFIHIIPDAIIMRSTSYSKIKMAIENLSSEGWFRELYEEPFLF